MNVAKTCQSRFGARSEKLALGEPPRVRHRDRLVPREALGLLPIGIGERVGALLLGQVEVADGIVADADRHAEETRHRRMMGREAGRAGIIAPVAQPEGPLLADQDSEDAVAAGQVADRLPFGRGHAGGDEVGEETVRADDAEGAVPCAEQGARQVDDVLEDGVEIELGGDRQDRLIEAVELGEEVLRGRLFHSGFSV